MIAQPAVAVLGVLAFSAEGVTGPVRTTFAGAAALGTPRGQGHRHRGGGGPGRAGWPPT
jgi:hypothetical protein